MSTSDEVPSFVDRPATETEIASLRRLLRELPTAGHRWRQAGQNALVLWAVSLLVVYLIWLLLSWLSSKVLGTAFGMSATSTRWVMAVAVPVCCIYSCISSVRWVRQWRDLRPLVRADLQAGRIAEERCQFDEARRFQEPEHGGFVYFFRTGDRRAFASYDYESQDLGAREEDPSQSKFRALNRLTIVRAPSSRYIISRIFSGEILDVGDTIELAADPKDWPEHDEICDIRWDELESRLAPERTG